MAKKETTKKDRKSAEVEQVRLALIVRASKVDTADIETWKSAVNTAYRGSYNKLMALYENLISDPVLSHAIEQRINQLIAAELTFVGPDGKSINEIEDLIDTPEFEELLKEIALSKAYGKSVIELSFAPHFDVFSFPRRNIKITNLEKPFAERKKLIVRSEGDMTGYEYSDNEYILECGKDNDLGYLFKAAQFVIYKRGGFGDWAQFAEVFGMPFLIGKYNSYDPKSRDLLFQALQEIGSSPRAAIPNETDIEIKENNASGNGMLFKHLRDACNEEILISVLGNTMTTLQGSSRAQGEVHQDTQTALIQADKRYVQRMLNRFVTPLLEKRGYPTSGGFFLFPDQKEELSMEKRVDLALKLRKEGISIDDDYFYEVSGIPKGAKKEEKKPEKAEITSDNKKDDPEVSQKKNKLGFFVQAPAKTGAFIRQLKQSITGKVTLEKGVTINVTRLLEEALKEIYDKQGESVVNANLFKITNDPLQKGTIKEFSATSEFGKRNEEFISEFRTNTAVFAAFKAHKQTQEYVDLLIDEKGNLRPFNQFKKEAQKISKDYNISWLQTEYNTAVKSARSAVNYRKFLETEHLYPNLEYIESTAAHPRASHLEYVGTILPIRHPWWKTHIPPSEWNCACGIKQTDKEPTPVPGEVPGSPVFENNPGESGQFINLKEHPYIKGICPYFNECAIRKGPPTKLKDGGEQGKLAQCQMCFLALSYMKNQKRIEENRKEYERLKKDPNYTNVKFNPKTGGLMASHKDHQFDKQKGIMDIPRGDYEKRVQEIFFKYGRKLILQNERMGDNIATPDGLLDDVLCDIKAIEGLGMNNIINKIAEANHQGARHVILYYPDINLFKKELLRDGYSRYLGLVKKKNIQDNVDDISYVIEGKIYKYK